MPSLLERPEDRNYYTSIIMPQVISVKTFYASKLTFF